ncbi:hypothetical protein MOUN0_O02542 [Monosporozyma unispora]
MMGSLWKIIFRDSSVIESLRQAFEMGKIGIPTWHGDKVKTYFKVSYKFRLMSDQAISGMSWLTLPKGKYEIVPNNERVSTAQFEVSIDYRDLIILPIGDQIFPAAPLRIL